MLKRAKRYKIPVLVIGSGSNILVNDKGVDGVVVKLTAPCFRKIRFKSGLLEAGAGGLLSKLVRHTLDLNLSGCEFLSGIPGTVGGALVMNAGVSERVKNVSIGNLVENVTAMDYNGNIKILHKRDIEFGYRKSNLSKYIILNARIRLRKKRKQEIRQRIKWYLDYRRSSQELSSPNAGCIFKNPSGLSAGRLIDMCGLKGSHFGDARVSSKHANFIINKGEARAAEVLKLMDYIKVKVKQKFNITLQPEVRIWRS